jgi:hypothetical protein
MTWLQATIVITALVCAVLCFAIYFFVSIEWLKPAAKSKAEQGADHAFTAVKSFTPASAADLAEVLKGAASLVDSLAKVGPALWALIGSILLLVVAATAAQLLSGQSSSPATNTSAAAPTQNTVSPSKIDPTQNLPVTKR